MPETPGKSLFFALGFSLVFSSFSNAKPVLLKSILEESGVPTKKGKKSKKPQPRLADEYRLFERAREILDKKSTVSAIESIQRELLLSKLKSEIKPLERELEEVFLALEIKKGTILAKRKVWSQAWSSLQRGILGLSTSKWPYYWTDDASSGLEGLCSRDEEKPDEACLQLARRLVDVFPKAANETEELRSLELPDPVTAADFGGDRLSQAYSEKIEKDEEVFKSILDSYLKGLHTDMVREVREFLELYPRSAHRFRANFLLAEVLMRGGNQKDAESIYRGIIDQIPLSYYSIIASERIGFDLRSKISEEPLSVDIENQNLNPTERASVQRALDLVALKKPFLLGVELENFSKLRNYSDDYLLYLMKIASAGGQDLLVFRFANELIQRKFPRIANREILGLLFPETYLPEVQVEASRSRLDPLLILSLIKQESGFKADVISSSGALGLMQLMPFTAVDVQKDLRLATLRDPAVNIAVGVRYFQTLMEKYEGNPAYALAAYNAGPHRVGKWRKESGATWSLLDWVEAIPFKETRDYVTSILRNRFWYQVQKGMVPAKITELKPLTAPANADKN